MSNPRLLASQGVAAVALFLALLNDLGLVGSIEVKPAVTRISALVLALVAFAIAARAGSVLVSSSSFLTLQGVADVAASASAGATIGIPFGLLVLVLGVTKGIITRRGMRATGESVAAGRPAVGKALVALVVVPAAIVEGIGACLATAAPTSAVTTTSTRYTGPPPVQVSICDGFQLLRRAGIHTGQHHTGDGLNNTVTWTNNDSVRHTVTSISAPPGASLTSGNMNGGAVHTHTFAVAGTYKCNRAYRSWMTGTIIVKAGSQ